MSDYEEESMPPFVPIQQGAFYCQELSNGAFVSPQMFAMVDPSVFLGNHPHYAQPQEVLQPAFNETGQTVVYYPPPRFFNGARSVPSLLQPPRGPEKVVPPTVEGVHNYRKSLAVQHDHFLSSAMECNNYLSRTARPGTYSFRINEIFLPASVDGARIYLSPVRMSCWLEELIGKKLERGEDCIFQGSLIARYLNQFVALNDAKKQPTMLHSMERELRPCDEHIEEGVERNPAIERRLNLFLRSAEVQVKAAAVLKKLISSNCERLGKEAFVPTVLLKIVKIERSMVWVRYVAVDSVEDYKKAVYDRISFVRQMHEYSKTQFACFWSFPHCMGISYHSLMQDYIITSFDKVPSQLRDTIDVDVSNEHDRRSAVMARISAFKNLFFYGMTSKDQNTVYHNACERLWKLSKRNVDQYKVNLRTFGDACVSMWEGLIRAKQDDKTACVLKEREKLLDMYGISHEIIRYKELRRESSNGTKQIPHRKRGQRGGGTRRYYSSPFGTKQKVDLPK